MFYRFFCSENPVQPDSVSRPTVFRVAMFTCTCTWRNNRT